MTPVSLETTEDEPGRLHYWKVDRYRELGYDWSDAQKMVCLDIDWHELKDLLEHDCNPRLAVDILA